MRALASAPVGDERARRLANNERLIREANRQADRAARDDAGRRADADTTEVEFGCACGRPRCDETILLTVSEYEVAHRKPHRFIIAPGHQTPAIERVVERHRTYYVVEKRPAFQAD